MRRMFSVLIICVCTTLAASAAADQPADADAGESANAVDSLQVDERPDGTYIRIHGSAEPTFSVFKLTNPLRLFVDISASRLDGAAQTKRVANGVISKVALIEFDDNARSVARLIIGFDQPAHYDVNADGKDVVVFVDGDKRRDAPAAVANMQDKLDQRDQRLSQTKDRLKAVETQYEQDLSDSRSRYQSAMGRLEQTRDKLESTRRKLGELRARLKRAPGAERDQLEAKIDRQSQRLANTRSTMDGRQKKVAQLRAELDQLRDERDRAAARADKLDRKRRAAAKRADKLADRLHTTRQTLESVAAEKDQINGRLSTMADKAQQSSETIDRQLAKIEAAKQRQHTLEAKLGSLRQSLSDGNDQVRGQLEEISAEKKRLSQRLDDQRGRLEQTRADARKANDRLDTLKARMAERDREVSRLRAQLDQARTEQSARDADGSTDTRLSRRLAKVRRQLDREQRHVAAVEHKRQDEQAKLDKLASRREQAGKKLASTEAKIDAHRDELDTIRRRQHLPKARAVAVEADEINHVRDIRLETDQGRSRIVVELDRPSDFKTQPGTDSRAVMILDDVKLPKNLEQTLAADGHGGAVRFVSTYTDQRGAVHMEAELKNDASEMVRQDGKKVVWEFAPKVGPNAPVGALADGADGAQPRRATDGQTFTAAPPNYPRSVPDPTKVNTVPGMRRKRLTIDLRSADIQNVLRLLAKQGGVNIIAGDGVSGSVTMRLRSVPLDQVFLTILQSQGLGFEVRGSVIRVATQETLVKEQKTRAEARARAEKLQPLEVFLLPVNYAEAGQMQSQVKSLLSPRGSVSVDQRTNTLIIKDLSDNLGSIRSLVENLDSQVPQVLIEARIVETNDTFDRQLGIQWGGDFSFSQGNGNPTGLVFPSVLGVAGGATDGQTPTAGTSSNPNFAVNLPAPAGTGAGGAIGLTMGSVGGAVNLNLRLSALESSGHAKIVSSPRILTLDNTEATISQGTSIPISVVSAAGVQTVFVDATLELTVKPHVTPDGNIQLQISASKNEPDFQNTGASGDPTIIRKQAETELLIKDGDTTVIGGIYTRNAGSNLSAVPFLHKIPILGNLFKTSSTSERRTELLIFITPRIVNREQSLGSNRESATVGDRSASSAP